MIKCFRLTLSLGLSYFIAVDQFPVFGQTAVPPLVEDFMHPSSSVLLSGFIAERIDASYENRILVQDVDRLVEPFRNRTEESCWQSEFWGKWLTSAVSAYRYRPELRLRSILDKAVSDLIATQTADGYIGNYADSQHLQQWDIWGRKYCMLGLLAYYDLTHDIRSLNAARKLADHLLLELSKTRLPIVKMGNHRGMAATSVLEPITLLYSRTGDKHYLDFAEEIVRNWESADGPQLISRSGIDVSKRFPKPTQNWFGWEQGQKAYEMMSCYEGLLELYRITGKIMYRTAVEKTWENIHQTELNIVGSGSAMECWFGGRQFQTLAIKHYQETCVTVTWIKLSQQLLRLTGEAKYADAIEQTYYNALLGSMKTDGSDWAKYTGLSGQRMKGSQQCNMGINCCEASGPRGLFTLPFTAVMNDKEGFSVNFFINGMFRIQTPRGQIAELNQGTDYPSSGITKLELKLLKAENMVVRIRIPGWSRQTRLTVNGQALKGVMAGEYASIRRIWQSGDVINLSLDMRGRLVKMGTQPEYVAILRGPLVLTRDARLGGPDVDEPITPLADRDGFVDLQPVVPTQRSIWLQFEVHFNSESYAEGAEKRSSLLVCDYASAGNTYDEKSRYRVWLPQLLDPAKIP